MHKQTLDGIWLLRQRDTQVWLQASVPGGVHTDLLAAGRIPDPFTGTNEEQVQWVAEKDWEYRHYFHPHPAIRSQEKVYLVCDGLDTLADVRLNGKILGLANNMFHPWRWEVTNLLQDGENRLDILFHAPAAYARQRQRVNPLIDPNMGIRGGPHLRKAPSHFGWDWGPRLPCIGIWRGVRLEGASGAQIEEVRFEQQHENGMVMLTTRVRCALETAREALRTIRVRVTAPDRQVWQADAPARAQQAIPIKITNPALWWPNGLGEPAIYQVEVDLLEEEQPGQETQRKDTRAYQLGLRTLELRQEEDEHGRSFGFLVNGAAVFIKGANWIPADSFPTRVTPETYEHLVRSAAEANLNMLRVWGGGYYEDDLFYDLCNRYGILVWQDCMFACATYPLDDPAYRESVRREVSENARRLRHHACLALWCGNNEIEWQTRDFGWIKKQPGLAEAYQKFFFHELPELLAVEDPGRPYWPSSPSSNEPFNEPNSHRRGDAHLWEVYHGYKLPAYYREQNPRFASEFGFQSLPAPQTLAAFAGPGRARPDPRSLRAHQRVPAGNSRLAWYLAQRFRLPRGLDDLAYLSQVYQAEAMRAGVEHWRRHPEITGGALYWQLNDCWPAISWSSIDYYGRWKALHYAARRFFAPVALSIEEQATKRQPTAAVWLANDSCLAWNGELRWTLETLDGTVLEGGDQAAQAGLLSVACLLRQDFAESRRRIDWRRVIFTAELWQDGQRRALQVAAFVPEKVMPLGDPGLQAFLEQVDDRLAIRLQAQRLARFVQLDLAGADVLFSDNYFDLPAGRSASVECALPRGWTLEQAQAALQVRSLAGLDCYPAAASRLQSAGALVDSLASTLLALARR
jgi:beta-mannosidase